MAMGDHLRHHRWSGGPSMAAILGLGGTSTATYLLQMVRGTYFGGTICGMTVHEAVSTNIIEFRA